MLVLVDRRPVCGRLADTDLTAVDVEFADDGRLVEFPPNRVVGESEPTESDQQVILEVLEAK